MRKKLIEVALPLEEINIAAAREKSIRHGHPSTLHLWWARRPLAACRAILFASIIDDPDQEGVPQTLLERIDQIRPASKYTLEWDKMPEGEQRRKRLFTFIERLVQWENSNDEDTLRTARELIHAACLPPLPPETDDFSTILGQGQTFDGYAAFGPGPEEIVRRLQPLRDEYRKTGRWPGTLRELRGTLFYMVREFRFTSHDYSDPTGDALREWQSLYRTIRERWDEVEPDLPPVLDPFAGGGSIPLEAQRLGLEAHALDLNPVAVLINKAMIEIPPKFANQPPVNPEARSAGGKDLQTWRGAQGLAEDVRYYGKWMRNEAEKRIGHLYPKAKLPKEYGGGEATVIAWIWARTVPSPNPAAKGAHVPLVRSFALSTKKGKEAWVEPVLDASAPEGYRFEVQTARSHPGGKPRVGTIGKKGGVCVLTGAPMDLKYVREQAQARKMGARLMAIVAEAKGGRIYLSSTEEQERIALSAEPSWKPDGELVHNSRHMTPVVYGMTGWADLFTGRQLTSLSAFAELVGEAQERVSRDSDTAEHPKSCEYSDGVTTYLAFGLDKALDRNTSLCTWESKMDRMKTMFARQAISMTWDFVETNPFAGAGGDIYGTIHSLCEVLDKLVPLRKGNVSQRDAAQHGEDSRHYLIATDPPYYDNVPYADLSDFFYVWLRRTLRDVYPDLFGTMTTPKTAELIADPFRHGGKDESRAFFEKGMGCVFARMRETAHPKYPISVIYAFKQSESEADDAAGENGKTAAAVASTGWETMLEGLLRSGLKITGTWPMRTELASRTRGIGSNALASSIALICRPREENAESITRREFQSILRAELPDALRALQQGNVAPVDLAQSAIGPGMAVFSRYAEVLEANGKPMSVRTALQVINQMLDEVLEEQEGWYDESTRWAVAWFQQYGFNVGEFGTANTLATAKAISVSGLVNDGIVQSGGGKVKLLSRDELPEAYDPAQDARATIWEVTQYLTRALDKHGIQVAGQVMRRFRDTHPEIEVERAKDLAYRLYALCDAKRWAQEARPYNALVLNWGDIETASQEQGLDTVIEGGLFGQADTEGE